ncbi:O-antigen translocase, partial [Chromobacterium violaceum]
ACVLIVPFSAVNILINSIFNGLQQYRKLILSGIVSVLISTLLTITLIVLYKLNGVLLSVAMASAVSGAVMFCSAFLYKSEWLSLAYWLGPVSKVNIKGVGSYVIMALSSAISIPLSFMFVRNTLVENVGWDVTGEWQAVYKISETYLAIITMGLSTYYLPRLSTLADSNAIRKEIFSMMKIVMPIVIVLALFIYSFRDLIINLLFTKQFSGARDLFFIQLVGDVIKIASWIIAFPMLSRGNVKWFVGSEVLFSIFFVLLTCLLVPHLGVHGANAAYTTNYVLYFIFVHKNLDKYIS